MSRSYEPGDRVRTRHDGDGTIESIDRISARIKLDHGFSIGQKLTSVRPPASIHGPSLGKQPSDPSADRGVTSETDLQESSDDPQPPQDTLSPTPDPPPIQECTYDPQEMRPRPYQTEALHALTDAFSRHNRILLALPTGSGKTFVAAKWIYDHVLSRGKKVIWVAHRRELLEQAYLTFVRLLPAEMAHEISWWGGGRSKNPYGRLIFVSIAAARDFPQHSADLLVIDEAHHEAAGSYRRFQGLVRAEKHLGLTATPRRLDEKALGYEEIAYQKTFMSLVSEGWLAKPEPVIPRTNMAFEMSEGIGDFDEASLATLDSSARNAFVARHWNDHADRYGKTLIFAINRDHARNLTEAIRRESPRARVAYIVSNEGTSAERDQTISRFRDGDLEVLVNCRIFTEGFDCPDVKTVMLTRPTMSSTLYLQMIGRGTRVAKGKRSFYLVDFQDDLGRFQDQLIRPWVLGEKLEQRRGEPVESEPRERIELPAIFEDEISVDEVDLSRLAGYVLYESGPGREDGFLVHEVDEEVFLRMWSGLEEAANTRFGTGLALEVISAWDAPEPVTSAAPSGSSVGASGSDPAISQTGRPSARLQRIPLQGLLAAAVALGEGKAQYISLREPELPVAVLEFLSDRGSVEQEQQELARELDQVHALLKYTNDEIDRQPQWARVYVGERDDFEQYGDDP
jgi:superfamily II DNA or RNA helicase